MAIFTARKRSLREGYVFTPVCDSVNRGGRAWLLTGGACVVAHGGVCVVAHGGGACVVAQGGHAWLLGGACVVAHRGAHAWLFMGGARAWLLMGGHAWLLMGGMHGCSRGGGVRGCSWGACMVAHGGACVVARGGRACFFLDEVRSMSERYASYWNAFLLPHFILRIKRLDGVQVKINLNPESVYKILH